MSIFGAILCDLLLNNNTNSKAALAMGFGNFDTKQDTKYHTLLNDHLIKKPNLHKHDKP